VLVEVMAPQGAVKAMVTVEAIAVINLRYLTGWKT
jgi:hypothetical protein